MAWKFRTYVAPSGRTDVQHTIDDYDVYGRNKFARAVMHLAVSPKSQWDEPHAKKLKNEDPIYEIRYQAFKRQERALGFFDDETGVFVIVLVCYHKGRVYKPAEAIDSAHRRIAEVRAGTATTAPLQVAGENFPPDER